MRKLIKAPLSGCLFLLLLSLAACNSSESSVASVTLSEGVVSPVRKLLSPPVLIPVQADKYLGNIVDIVAFDQKFALVDNNFGIITFVDTAGQLVRQLTPHADHPEKFEEINSYVTTSDKFVVSDATEAYVYNRAVALEKVHRRLKFMPDMLAYSPCEGIYSISLGSPRIVEGELGLASIYALDDDFAVGAEYLPLKKEVGYYFKFSRNYYFNKGDTLFVNLDHLQGIYYKSCDNKEFQPLLKFDDHTYSLQLLEELENLDQLADVRKRNPYRFHEVEIIAITDDVLLLRAYDNLYIHAIAINRHTKALRTYESIDQTKPEELLLNLAIQFPTAYRNGYMHSYVSGEYIWQLKEQFPNAASLSIYDEDHAGYIIKTKVKL